MPAYEDRDIKPLVGDITLEPVPQSTEQEVLNFADILDTTATADDECDEENEDGENEEDFGHVEEVEER